MCRAYGVYSPAASPDKGRPLWHACNKSGQFEVEPNLVVLGDFRSVRVAGATGHVALQVNGVFDAAEELSGGWIRCLFAD